MMRRREFCLAVAASTCVDERHAWSQTGEREWTLGYSSYALPKLTAEDAIRFVAGLGFDTIELTIMADRDIAPEKVTPEKLKRVVEAAAVHRLRISSLMENLRPMDDEARHTTDCQRLERACRLAKQLHPQRPPIVQTVLGQRNWNDVRELCLRRIRDWVTIAERHGVVVGIKPHRGHAMSRPEDAVWLLEKLGKPPHLRMVFDYSHFIYRDMPLEKVIEDSLPYTAHIAVKDAVMVDGAVRFQLPGEAGTIDYAKMLRLFDDGGYRGDVCVEVSSQVWRQDEYQFRQAAKFCYKHMNGAFVTSGIQRGARP